MITSTRVPQRTVQEHVAEALSVPVPVPEPCLSASAKIKKSRELARPMAHLDPRYQLTQEFMALYDTLA